ncbi:MAG: ester cyclase, partial [bacterium]
QGSDGQVERGQDAGVAIIQIYRSAFPDDLKVDIQHIHSSGDTAVVEFIGGGTRRGELAGVAPTGRRAQVPVVTVLEMRDGKVHTEREYFDTGYIMKQLGVVPAAATA